MQQLSTELGNKFFMAKQFPQLDVFPAFNWYTDLLKLRL